MYMHNNYCDDNLLTILVFIKDYGLNSVINHRVI